LRTHFWFIRCTAGNPARRYAEKVQKRVEDLCETPRRLG
jgi:hypothetical protein